MLEDVWEFIYLITDVAGKSVLLYLLYAGIVVTVVWLWMRRGGDK